MCEMHETLVASATSIRAALLCMVSSLNLREKTPIQLKCGAVGYLNCPDVSPAPARSWIAPETPCRRTVESRMDATSPDVHSRWSDAGSGKFMEMCVDRG